MRPWDRARVLTESFNALGSGITAYSFETAVTDVGCRDWHLVIDLKLSEGPVARFADLLFHGSERAHELNGSSLKPIARSIGSTDSTG